MTESEDFWNICVCLVSTEWSQNCWLSNLIDPELPTSLFFFLQRPFNRSSVVVCCASIFFLCLLYIIWCTIYFLLILSRRKFEFVYFTVFKLWCMNWSSHNFSTFSQVRILVHIKCVEAARIWDSEFDTKLIQVLFFFVLCVAFVSTVIYFAKCYQDQTVKLMTCQWSSSTVKFSLNVNVSINNNSFRTMQLNIGFPKMFQKNGEDYIVAFHFQQHTHECKKMKHEEWWRLFISFGSNKSIFVHFSRCILFSLGHIC